MFAKIVLIITAFVAVVRANDDTTAEPTELDDNQPVGSDGVNEADSVEDLQLDPYELLGVDRTATNEQLEQAFQEKTKGYDADNIDEHNKSIPIAIRGAAVAYIFLKNPEHRAEYHRRIDDYDEND